MIDPEALESHLREFVNSDPRGEELPDATDLYDCRVYAPETLDDTTAVVINVIVSHPGGKRPFKILRFLGRVVIDEMRVDVVQPESEVAD